MQPEISVVIPTFRRPGALPGLFRSLELQSLSSTLFEVVLVDNGSDAGTVALLEKWARRTPLQVSVLSHTATRGPAGARNAGWRAASAPVVAFTDDDCLPDPTWLEAGLAAMREAPDVGVLQGRTTYPPGSDFGWWTVYRDITGPSPFFEACNIFYRREALQATGGFDEVAGLHFEDTAAGWAVVEGGWRHGFAEEAVVVHPVEDRGFVWHLRNGFAEANMVRVAAQHPGFREAALWRPWAYQPELVALLCGVLGCGVGLRHRRAAAALLLAPYAVRTFRDAPSRAPRYVAQRTAVDAARLAGHLRGSWRQRTLVL